MMKKRILAALITFALLISCFAGMASASAADNYGGGTLNELTWWEERGIETAEEETGVLSGRTRAQVKTLWNRFYENYYLVEYVGGGYMIVCLIDGEIYEYSDTADSPYLGYDSSLFYFGPTFCYYYTDGEFHHTVLNESFRLDEEELPGPEKDFEDVEWNVWFNECVYYCAANGILRGTSETRFSPDVTLTRAMFVTALYRLAGEPEVEGEMKFLDVPEGSFYYAPVLWGVQNEIVFGTGETTFAPDLPITREQMACLMVRYAKLIEADFLNAEGENKLADFSAVSDFAKDSVEAIARTGLMIGDENGMFDPLRQASRAEAAMIFMRLKQKLTPPQNAVLTRHLGGMSWELSEEDTQTLRELFGEACWDETEIAECPSEYDLLLDGVRYGFETLIYGKYPYALQVHVVGQYGTSIHDELCVDEAISQKLLGLLKSYLPTEDDACLYCVDSGEWTTITKEDASTLHDLLNDEKWGNEWVKEWDVYFNDEYYLVLDGMYYGIGAMPEKYDYPYKTIIYYTDKEDYECLSGTRDEVGEKYDAILEILSGYVK